MTQLAMSLNRAMHDPLTDGPGWATLQSEPDPKRRGQFGFQGDRTMPAFRVDADQGGEGMGYVGRFPDDDRALTYLRMEVFHRIGAERFRKTKFRCERMTAEEATPT